MRGSENNKRSENTAKTTVAGPYGNQLPGNDVFPVEKTLRSGNERTPVAGMHNEKVREPNAQEIIINVPGDYPTIQAAINAASNGDVISVAAGIYRKTLR